MDRSGAAKFATLRDALERRAQSRGLWLGVSVLLCIAHFARMYDVDQALLTDTRYYTFFGIQVANGAVPHLDFFGNKTQLASLVAGGLVWLGDLLGRGAVESIRVGSLGITALGGVLLFLLHRGFAAGRSIPGLLGLLPYLGLTYIGTLAASGASPKLIMAVSATGAALAVARGRWFAAGVISAISPLDWQIGLFACFGVLAAAALDANSRRALIRSACGIGAVALVFVGYFAFNGALEPMIAQTVGASFARGTETGEPFFNFAAIHRGLLMHCIDELWLVWLGLVGAVVFPFWFRGEAFREVRKPLVSIAVYHYGVVAFSCIDFQGSGDTMLLLHSVAFFAGIALVSGYGILYRVQKKRNSGLTTTRLGAAAVLVLLVLTRPVFSNPVDLWTPDSPSSVTLQDQLSMARRLARVLENRSVLVLGPTEMLILGGFSPASIYVFWNEATKHEYARTHPGTSSDLLADLVAEFKPGAILASRYLALPADIPYRGIDLGRPGGYAIRVFVRTEAPAKLVQSAPKVASTSSGRATRVVLVTIDTLRRDSLEGSLEEGAGGSSAMPLTRAWSRKGVVLDRHYAASSTTQPTHASLLTGLHPWQHGVSRNGQALAEHHTTLAEAFADQGYRTGAVVSSFPLHRSFGFAQGFDRFDDAFEIPVTLEWSGRAVPKGAFYSLGSSITDKALAMLDQLGGSRQFFWFHYFDLHEPYGDAAGRVEGRENVVNLGEIYAGIERNDPAVEKMVEHAKRRYEDDARALDRQLDRLIRRLYRDADRVDTHLVVVSDHGESFGERGSLGHGKRLSDELIHVPCFILSPGVVPGRVDVPVGSVDVPVTLLSLAGALNSSGTSALTKLGRDMSGTLPENRSVFGMRRTFAKPFDELRLDGRRHRLLDPVFFVADARGVTTGNAEQIIRGLDAEHAHARALFGVFAKELAETGSSAVLDEQSRAALEALGYVQ